MNALLFVLLVTLGMLTAAEGAQIHFRFGLAREADACWEEGDRLYYRTGGQTYHMEKAEVLRIEGNCPEPDAAVKAAGTEPGSGAGAAASESTPSGSTTPGQVGGAYTSPQSGQSAPGGDVKVRGYYRKDGTYVAPHTRSAPRRR